MQAPTVVILIDALGYDLTGHHDFHPPGLEHKARLKTVFGFSQAALTTIMTGLTPAQHRLWMMYSFSPESSPFKWLGLLPRSASTRRLWLRRLINWKLDRIDRIRAYYHIYEVPRNILPYLDLPARRSIYTPAAVDGCATLLDALSKNNTPFFIKDYRTPEKDAFDLLERALREKGEGYFFLYTAGLDADLHRWGCGDQRIREHLRWYRERIERIISVRSGIRIIVLGDHGMSDVSAHLDLISQIDGLGLKIPGDYIPFYDSTMARFRISSDRAREKLRGLLSALPQGRLLEGEERERLGVDFTPPLYGDMIFMVDNGTIILPSYISHKPIAGMHGYHPDNSEMYSVLFSNQRFPAAEGDLTDIADYIVPGFNRLRERS
ncbi:MAG: alkaline phosphatase family protein [Candidatus Krumholzibacteriota bacterium]|nr:alkaline phosphatase family protein [Candidatus Krumholzibacteriota bacterium]